MNDDFFEITAHVTEMAHANNGLVDRVMRISCDSTSSKPTGSRKS